MHIRQSIWLTQTLPNAEGELQNGVSAITAENNSTFRCIRNTGEQVVASVDFPTKRIWRRRKHSYRYE